MRRSGNACCATGRAQLLPRIVKATNRISTEPVSTRKPKTARQLERTSSPEPSTGASSGATVTVAARTACMRAAFCPDETSRRIAFARTGAAPKNPWQIRKTNNSAKLPAMAAAADATV